MIRKFICAFFFMLSLAVVSHAQFHFGPGVSFLADGDAIGIGGQTVFDVYDDRFKGAINAHYYVSGEVNWDINLDVQYQFLEIGTETYINPFTGLSIREEDEVDDEDTDLSLGLNLGLFFHTAITDDLRLFIEGKYSFAINGRSGSGIAAGIFF